MFIVRISARRLIASMMLAVLAVFAVLGSAHAGSHASGVKHGAAAHVGYGNNQTAALADDGSADQGSPVFPDSQDCSGCHGVSVGLAQGQLPFVFASCRGDGPLRPSDLLVPSVPVEGPRRPPRTL